MRPRPSPDSETDHRRKTSELTIQQIVLRRLRDMLGPEFDPEPGKEAPAIARIEQALETVINEQPIHLSPSDRERLRVEVIDELLGLGRLAPLMRDDRINNIYVYHPYYIMVERQGRLEREEAVFDSETALLRVIERLLKPLGLYVDAQRPIAHARLPDGWEANIIVPPAALHGPTLTMRRYARRLLSLEELIRMGMVSPPIVDFLRAAIIAGLNILVSGGARAGTTTLLNALVGFIPHDVRIIVIEQTPELHPSQEMLVRLVSSSAGGSRRPGAQGVTVSDLIGNLPHMNGERFIVGDLRGPEAFDYLASVNSGTRPMLAAVRADHPRDALQRLELLAMMGNVERSPAVIRRQIAHAVDLTVQIDRLRDGARKITAISEVNGVEDSQVIVNDIMLFEETGPNQGRVEGLLRATGLQPQCLDALEAAGIHLDLDLFRP